MAIRHAQTVPTAVVVANKDPSTEVRFDALCRWLETDEPLAQSPEDRFAYAPIVDRIADHLLNPKLPSLALLGDLGSGKTSILRLVQSRLDREPQAPALLAASLWPYETPSAAVHGILTRLVDSLAQEVSVLSLRGLPNEYVRVMAGAGGWLERVATLSNMADAPDQILRRVDRIATAIDRHFVIWIEDLDRFDPHADTLDDGRLDPIRALLHRLDELDHVSVVVASKTLGVRFDIEKIANYVERVPRLEAALVRQNLRCFEQGCRREAERANVIDPVATPADVFVQGDTHAHDPRAGDQRRFEMA